MVTFVMSLVCVPPIFLPVSPTIAGLSPDSSAEEVTVTLSSPTSLVCEVQSYPPALITWLKDGTPFMSSRNIRVLPGLTSQVHDMGTKTITLEYNSTVYLLSLTTHLSQAGELCRSSMLRKRMLEDIPVWPLMRLERH